MVVLILQSMEVSPVSDMKTCQASFEKQQQDVKTIGRVGFLLIPSTEWVTSGPEKELCLDFTSSVWNYLHEHWCKVYTLVNSRIFPFKLLFNKEEQVAESGPRSISGATLVFGALWSEKKNFVYQHTI